MITDHEKDLLRLALDSHNHCVHDDAQLCYTLTLIELEIKRSAPLTDDEVEDSKVFIADCILESLILKGYVEPSGIDGETGDFLVELTEAGEEAYQRATEDDDHGEQDQELRNEDPDGKCSK